MEYRYRVEQYELLNCANGPVAAGYYWQCLNVLCQSILKHSLIVCLSKMSLLILAVLSCRPMYCIVENV